MYAIMSTHQPTHTSDLTPHPHLTHLTNTPVGCVQFGGHRIAGLSGTYVSQHYHWGHHERLPYDERAVKSIYHVRQLEVHRLMQVGPLQIKC